MSKRIICSCLLMFTLMIPFSSHSYAQNKYLGEEDGSDWLEVSTNNYSKAYYLGYIAGVIMGLGVMKEEVEGGLSIAIRSLEKAKAIAFYLDIVKDARDKANTLQMDGITTKQISDGLDVFYSDFANRRINIIDAIFIVKMQIDGQDQDLIQAQIRFLRMPKISQEEFTRISLKITNETAIITEEEWLKMGHFRDKNNISHTLFRYGSY